MKTLLTVVIAGSLLPAQAGAVRLKDLVSIEGVRENQLIGYGLVVGLAGKGDSRQAMFSAQSLTNLLSRMGISVPPTAIRVTNTAAVMVTATLPAFAQPGMRIDSTAAAIGDCSNLQGGILLLTSLRGADGQVYAVAQGPVVTGGFATGRGGASQTVNHPTVGRSPNGAIVERAAPSLTPHDVVRLQLRQSDFTTSARIVEAVNKKFGTPPFTARSENAGLISVAIPPEYRSRPTEFVAELESLVVEADRPARVVVNERTGTIVLGKDVRIAPVGILHGNLSVEVQTTFAVSQPAPLSPQGTTEVVPQTAVTTKEEKARSVVLKQGATVEELVRALSAIGSTPRDVIAILQSLRSAGALEGEVEVI
ncbi:MAG TPA: flagellar basal body P-ring protein FlgI [Bryobacteraceae bacterium]|jgi:flagellar P-ring protein precursor FlgI|nr:flagellar basal body P-ring protein FlgI [Bryobacteraceae bacterium]